MEKVLLLSQISVNATAPVLSKPLRKGHDIKAGYEKAKTLHAEIIRDESSKGQAYRDIRKL